MLQVPSTLLYRASRDGFKYADWVPRCVGKGPTMTLVQVSRHGRHIQTSAIAMDGASAAIVSTLIDACGWLNYFAVNFLR